jgi:hypothetical protein
VIIAFYKGTRPGVQGLFSRAVRWWTGGSYSHTEVILETYEDGTVRMASSSFTDKGVRIKDRVELNKDHWDFVAVDFVSSHSEDWYKAHLGQKYDIGALVGYVWRRKDGSKNKWMCSESVAASMGFVEPWRFDPNTLYYTLMNSRAI